MCTLKVDTQTARLSLIVNIQYTPTQDRGELACLHTTLSLSLIYTRCDKDIHSLNARIICIKWLKSYKSGANPTGFNNTLGPNS